MVRSLSPVVRTFKVGKELFTSAGPEAIRMIHSQRGRVFLDLKFHDIPNTIGAACEVAARLGVFMMNVHILGGKNMLFNAVQAVHKVAEEKKIPASKLLGVTVLTSMTERDLEEVGIRKKMEAEVRQLALLAHDCGLDGVVASGHEIQLLRKVLPKEFLIVTPGVRPVWAAQGDQKRITTPKEAVRLGADFIVVGRPITQHRNPAEAAEKILEEI